MNRTSNLSSTFASEDAYNINRGHFATHLLLMHQYGHSFLFDNAKPIYDRALHLLPL
jgi:hypothetical protein